MKKSCLIISILLTFSFILVACNNGNGTNNTPPPDKNTNLENNNNEDEAIDEDDEELNGGNEEAPMEESKPLALFELSDLLIEAINQNNWETVAEYVHSEKGLLFSPYVHIDDEAIIIDREDVASLPASNETFTWGLYDGRGTPIDLTPTEYFEEFLDMAPFMAPDEVLIDDPQERGNTINNITKKFPNAHIVEYYNNGSEEYEGIDWSSILLIFEEDEEGVNQLVAIVRDMWTV